MTRSMRRVGALLGAGVATALVVTGCATGAGANDPAAGTGDGTHFTYWSMWQAKEPQAKVLQAAIDAFGRETGVKVDVQWQGRQVLQKLSPTLRTGAAADLVDQSVNQLGATLANTGQDTDLTGVYGMPVPGENAKVSDVIPQKYLPYLKDKDGKVFLVPYEVAGEAVWFDAAKNPDLATNPPRTWADLTAALDRMKTQGGTALAVDADNVGAATYWPLLVLQRQLGTDDLVKLAGDRTGASWDDPKVLAAAQKVEQLVKGGYLAPGFNAGQYPAQQNQWAQGKAALILQGSWVPSESASYLAPGFKPSSFQLPAIDGGNQAVGVNFFGFAVPKSAKNSKAATKFIAYFLNRQRLSGISTEAQNITPRTDIPAPEALTTLQQAFTSREVYPDGAGLALKYGTWQTTVLQPSAQALVQGRISAQDFVTQTKQASVDYWKSHG